MNEAVETKMTFFSCFGHEEGRKGILEFYQNSISDEQLLQ